MCVDVGKVGCVYGRWVCADVGKVGVSREVCLGVCRLFMGV